MIRESTIDPEKVRKIVEKLGIKIDIDPLSCYFLVWDGGREFICEYGFPPLIENKTSTSWL